MLFKQRFLDGIAAGSVTLAFRRWRRPAVKSGATLRTPVGVLAFEACEALDESAISEADAKRAGYASRAELLGELHAGRPGTLYRIRFRLAGPDPRIALREQALLPDAERAELERRLSRLDAASRSGPWTQAVLRLIARLPGARAGDLAAELGCGKEKLKLDVRKLKNLGLTESLNPGYRLSARGRAWLKSARKTTAI